MRFSAILTALGLLAFGAGNSFAGDCLRINPSAGAAFTTGAYSQGFSGGCSGAYTDAPTQTLEIRGFSTETAYTAPQAIILREVAPAPAYHQGQAIVVRQFNAGHAYGAPQPVILQQRAQPVIVRRQVVVQRQQGQAQQGVVGLLRVAANTVAGVAGAVIGR
jgi:hypothetical protein